MERPAILVRAPCVPVTTGTYGESSALTVRISLIVHEYGSQLTPRDSRRLCTAVLWPWLTCEPIRAASVNCTSLFAPEGCTNPRLQLLLARAPSGPGGTRPRLKAVPAPSRWGPHLAAQVNPMSYSA